MTLNIQKTSLAIAVAGAVSLGAFTVQAEDFTASATLQNTLAVENLQDFDIGTVFATATGAAVTDGVGVVVIGADGVLGTPASTSASVNLTSLSAPVPAQGSVAMAADFTLTLPDTSAIIAADMASGGTANATGLAILSDATALVHESANPDVPNLYLMHFTVEAVSGGSIATNTSNDGVFAITQDFGETAFVFNIGGTLTTEPTSASETYQAGVYSGTFEVTAAY